jgi:hypothetical protein
LSIWPSYLFQSFLGHIIRPGSLLALFRLVYPYSIIIKSFFHTFRSQLIDIEPIPGPISKFKSLTYKMRVSTAIVSLLASFPLLGAAVPLVTRAELSSSSDLSAALSIDKRAEGISGALVNDKRAEEGISGALSIDKRAEEGISGALSVDKRAEEGISGALSIDKRAEEGISGALSVDKRAEGISGALVNDKRAEEGISGALSVDKRAEEGISGALSVDKRAEEGISGALSIDKRAA